MSLEVLAFGVSNVWANTAIIAAIILSAYVLVMWLAAVLWTWRDIRSRTHDGISQAICVLLVAVLNFPGLLLYLLLRPQETLVERAEIEMEIDAFAREAAAQMRCPECDRSVQDNFAACPYCRAQLTARCKDCGRNLSLSWIMCPYCLAPRTEREEAAEPAAAVASSRSKLLRSWRNPGPPARTEPAPMTVQRNG